MVLMEEEAYDEFESPKNSTRKTIASRSVDANTLNTHVAAWDDSQFYTSFLRQFYVSCCRLWGEDSYSRLPKRRRVTMEESSMRARRHVWSYAGQSGNVYRSSALVDSRNFIANRRNRELGSRRLLAKQRTDPSSADGSLF